MFAMTFGEHVFWTFCAVCALLAFAVKLIGAIDDDGEVKKAANEGIAGWIRRLFK